MAGNIRVEALADGVKHVVFDRADSTANVFDQATMDELGALVDALAADPTVTGVVFSSAKPAIFIAGADVNEFVSGLDADGVDRLVRRGQEVFSKIAALRVPTVAAIHGACLGGGCELALACRARVASSDPATKIGLPETMLGIVPAWGGSTRLPRLVGLPAALGMILGGERAAARKAKKIGLVDRVVPKEHLLPAALALLAGPAPARKGHALTNNPLSARVIARTARKQTLRKTGGHYPAPLAALDVVVRGLSKDVAGSLDLERRAALELFTSPTTASLVRIFLLTERAKHLEVRPGVPAPPPVGRMAVIGAGVMGAGIAQWAAARGHEVILQDIDRGAVAKGLRTAAGLVENGVRRKVFEKAEGRRTLDRIAPAASDVPLPVDLVVEAAAERLEVKRAIFAGLERRSRPDTILATNTSSLSVGAIAELLERPGRVIGIHFFNPVHKMQLVEVVVGPRTEPAVVDRAVRWVQALGKLPVVCKDSPGFLVNRVLMPYLLEAGLLFAEGAKITEIDAAMTAWGMPMGPLRLIDEVGLDVASHAAQGMAPAFEGRITPPAVLESIAKQGLLGRKSGTGFYVYGKGAPQPNAAVAALQRPGAAARLTRDELAERMVLPLLNEATRVLGEGIVAAPEDVDLGMILGTGFAPFRGGPLRTLDALGARTVLARLTALEQAHGARFTPAALLAELARDGRTIYHDQPARRVPEKAAV